jgi:hypothetical protein
MRYRLCTQKNGKKTINTFETASDQAAFDRVESWLERVGAECEKDEALDSLLFERIDREEQTTDLTPLLCSKRELLVFIEQSIEVTWHKVVRQGRSDENWFIHPDFKKRLARTIARSTIERREIVAAIDLLLHRVTTKDVQRTVSDFHAYDFGEMAFFRVPDVQPALDLANNTKELRFLITQKLAVCFKHSWLASRRLP